MSEAFSVALVESILDLKPRGSEPVGLLSGNPTAKASLESTGLAFPFTETSPPLTSEQSSQLMSLSVASPASHSVTPEKEKAQPTKGGFGPSLRELFRKPGQLTLLSKTSQDSSAWTMEQSWEKYWKDSKAKVIQRSDLYLLKLPALERHTAEKGFSSWPTPTTADTFTGNLKSTQQKPGSMHSVNLSQAVMMWPTPSVMYVRTDVRKPGEHSKAARKGGCRNLREEVQKWPTPTTRDWKDGTSIGSAPVNGLLGRAVEPTKTKGSLDPAFSEYLLGFPQGWSVLKLSEMPSSPKSREKSPKQSKRSKK